MSGQVHCYKVVYHYIKGGKVVSPAMQDHLIATAGDAVTLAAVLAANGKGAPNGGTIEFQSIANAGFTDALS